MRAGPAAVCPPAWALAPAAGAGATAAAFEVLGPSLQEALGGKLTTRQKLCTLLASYKSFNI